MTSLRSVTSTLMMANRDVLYNQVIPNTWKFLIFIFPRGRIRMCEIRFSSTGVICGNPYPVCKKRAVLATEDFFAQRLFEAACSLDIQ